MITAQSIFNLIIAFILIGFVLNRVLNWLNVRHWNPTVPDEMKGFYDEEKYRSAREYALVNSRFSMVSSGFSTLVILVFLYMNGFAIVNQWAMEVSGNSYVQILVFFGVLLLASDLLNTPFSVYHTFVIEEQFGFNRTTVKTFVMDKIKSYLLGALLGGGIMLAITWFFNYMGENFWWITWIFVAGFSVFMMLFYTSLIVPIFNKLRPMEEGDLRDAIEAFCKKVGFNLSDLFIIDGSKRSSKSNAYFSGLGRRKKIILYDTLIEQQENKELVAVLAHEIGHYKLKHTLVGLLLSIVQTGLMLFLLGLMLKMDVFANALGVDEINLHIGLIVFSLLYAPVSLVLGILMNIVSRRHEFQADRYAAEHYNGEALVTALKKLSVENLSNLHPHPAHVFVNYSHPPVLKRIEAIRKVERDI